jgi:hypothetical protein
LPGCQPGIHFQSLCRASDEETNQVSR